MAHIRVMHDLIGEALTAYWAEPSPAPICDDTGDGVILIMDSRTGEVIGFERLYYRPAQGIATFTFMTSS